MPQEIVLMPQLRIDPSATTWTTTGAFVQHLADETSKQMVDAKSDVWRKDRVKPTDPVPGFKDAIALEIGSVAEVAAVFIGLEDRLCRVWTIVPESEPNMRRRIYSKEKNLIGRFPQLDFEFNIAAAASVDLGMLKQDPPMELAWLRA